ncbi:hypothetical protein EDB86DRAFT_382041 [Lactarius hatsudake]|nr:hypothetical protein EDB86DRAFT_382041 [Lactarius hatsudake]
MACLLAGSTTLGRNIASGRHMSTSTRSLTLNGADRIVHYTHQIDGSCDHLPVRLKIAARGASSTSNKRTFETLHHRLRPLHLILPPAHLADHQMNLTTPSPACRNVSMNGSSLPGTGTATLRLRARFGSPRDQVERQPLARVALLECFALCRHGQAFAAVLAAFWKKALVVAYVVMQEADSQGCAGRFGQDRSAADEEVGGQEMFRRIFRELHLFVFPSQVLWMKLGGVVSAGRGELEIFIRGR